VIGIKKTKIGIKVKDNEDNLKNESEIKRKMEN